MTNNDENWETQEVIRFLINDDVSYQTLKRMSAEDIHEWVVYELFAPAGLYESFDRYPRSNFEDVDWEAVARSLQC